MSMSVSQSNHRISLMLGGRVGDRSDIMFVGSAASVVLAASGVRDIVSSNVVPYAWNRMRNVRWESSQGAAQPAQGAKQIQEASAGGSVEEKSVGAKSVGAKSVGARVAAVAAAFVGTKTVTPPSGGALASARAERAPGVSVGDGIETRSDEAGGILIDLRDSALGAQRDGADWSEVGMSSAERSAAAAGGGTAPVQGGFFAGLLSLFGGARPVVPAEPAAAAAAAEAPTSSPLATAQATACFVHDPQTARGPGPCGGMTEDREGAEAAGECEASQAETVQAEAVSLRRGDAPQQRGDAEQQKETVLVLPADGASRAESLGRLTEEPGTDGTSTAAGFPWRNSRNPKMKKFLVGSIKLLVAMALFQQSLPPTRGQSKK